MPVKNRLARDHQTCRSKDKDYKFTPWDGTPGLKFEKFEKDLLLVAAGEVHKRGWSLADHLLTEDEGGAHANAPAMPVGNNQDARDAEAGQRKRRKESFTLITYHITDEDLVESLKTDYFQRGLDCYVHLQTFRRPTNNLTLRDMNKEWDEQDLLTDVGIREDTIKKAVSLMKVLNGRRPAAHRKTENEQVEKLLELIFTASEVRCQK